jgi:hypothetical protein
MGKRPRSEAPPPAPVRRVRGKVGEVLIKDLDGTKGGTLSVPVDIQRWKPGEAPGGLQPCYICGSTEHRRAACPNKLEHGGHAIQRKLVCLGCRQRGHVLKDCPLRGGRLPGAEVGICFNCGASDHALRDCLEERAVDGALPYASCFVCGAKGHLSRSCPRGKGLYPKGGGCKRCGSTAHLVADCPSEGSGGGTVRGATTTAAAVPAAASTAAPLPSSRERATQASAAAPASATQKRGSGGGGGGEEDIGGNVAIMEGDGNGAALGGSRKREKYQGGKRHQHKK